MDDECLVRRRKENLGEADLVKQLDSTHETAEYVEQGSARIALHTYHSENTSRRIQMPPVSSDQGYFAKLVELDF